MKRTRRSNQVGDVIRAELSGILQRDISDPDLGFLTVTEVEISADLQYAKVYVSSLSKQQERQKTLAVLKRRAGHIRHLLAQRANMRFTPELDFRMDDTAERAESIDRILQKVKPKDDRSR